MAKNDPTEIQVDEGTERARQAAFSQIKKKAILINLTCKQLANLPYDVNSSKKLAETMGVKDPNMVQVRKSLLNPQHLSKVRGLINDAMLMVWNHTRPWENIGYRLLPMEYYDDFSDTFSKIKDEFEEAVNEFTANYDNYVAEAATQLGKMFDKNDYPDKNQLSNFFKLDMQTSNFPDIDDIRLNLSGPELMEMQESVLRSYKDVLRESINDLMELINVGGPSDQVNRLIHTTELLNVEDDPEISLKLAEIKDTVGYVPPTKTQEDDDEGMMVVDDLADLDELDEIDLI